MNLGRITIVNILACAVMALLLGMIVTVAVAWGCVLWSAPVKSGQDKLQFINSDHPVGKSISRFGKFDGFAWFGYQGIGWSHDHVIAGRRSYSVDSPYNDNKFDLISAGWPLLCFDGERRTVNGVATRWRLLTLPHAWGPSSGRNTLIPFAPRWAALLANSALYASVICAMILGTWAIRRTHRLRRNRCPRCAYELRGIEPTNGRIRCPECGALVARSHLIDDLL